MTLTRTECILNMSMRDTQSASSWRDICINDLAEHKGLMRSSIAVPDQAHGLCNMDQYTDKGMRPIQSGGDKSVSHERGGRDTCNGTQVHIPRDASLW